MYDSIRAVQWDGGMLCLLDQRELPQQEVYRNLSDVNNVAQAIRDMVVRGAPAIGITAAYGVVIAARHRYAQDAAGWKRALEADMAVLSNARLTAVNLFWALQRMREAIAVIDTANEPTAALLAAARRIHEDDVSANRRMGELGAQLVDSPCAVITHCNTGSLATGGYGTALGVIRSAYSKNKITQVYADETRPWLQGARLTAWELVKDGIPVTLLADSAAAHLMKQGQVKWVIVGSDRIAANGDVANKIGTYNLAIAAKYHGVKFMVVAPTSTVDMSVDSGSDIPIETRSTEEVLAVQHQRIAAPGADAWNPAFDITPADLIDAIVTEKGVVAAPTADKIAAMMENDL
jgi:methylthioribose-1-phosphate isomerase